MSGRVLALAAALLAIGCFDTTDPPDPVPGPLTYQLVSPHPYEGAVLFSVPAGEVREVVPVDRFAEVLLHEENGTLFVVVSHRWGGPLDFRVEAADTRIPPQPVLLQVVGPDNHRRALTDYALEVVP